MFRPFVAQASCCACELRPWLSTVGGSVCTTSPYVSRFGKEVIHAWCGAERGSYQPLRLGCYTQMTGPASAWLVGCFPSAERRTYQHVRLVCYTRITGPASLQLIGSGCGAERRSYQHARLARYIRRSGPASERPVGPGSCADTHSAPEDPVRGLRPLLVPGSSPGGVGSCCLVPPGSSSPRGQVSFHRMML